MSETNIPQNPEANPVNPENTQQLAMPLTDEVPQLTAGQAIRQAREAAGVTVGHLAASLKVPAKTILALEDNNVAALPDLAFSRALAASICRNLKIDVNHILGLMPNLPQPHVVTNQEVGLNLPMARNFKFNFSLSWFRSSTFAIIAALALATLAVANWPVVMEWLNKLEKSTTQASSSQSAPVTADVSSVVTPSAVSAGSTLVTTETAPAAVASGPAVTGSSPAVAVAASAPVAVAPGSGNQLVFKATAPSWIEVTDMAGKPVWKKLLAPNESVPVVAPIPSRVLIGNVAGTVLSVNGSDFNVAPFAANNIARFEVK